MAATSPSLKELGKVVQEVVAKELIPVRKMVEEKIEFVRKDLIENFGSMKTTLAQHTQILTQHTKHLERLDTDVVQLQSALRATKDELLTEIKGIREEIKSDIKPRLDDHETRLTALETQ